MYMYQMDKISYIKFSNLKKGAYKKVTKLKKKVK